MDQGASSRTALTVAVQRAIHQVADEEPKILVDPIAARLVEAAAPGMLARELETAHLPRWRRGRAQWVMRSRFMEDELAARAGGCGPIRHARCWTRHPRVPPARLGDRAAHFRGRSPVHPGTEACSPSESRHPDPGESHLVPIDFEHDPLE